MPRTREQMGSALAEIMQASREELLDWCAATPRPTLTQIEEKVLAWREALSEATSELLLESQAASAPAEAHCPECGRVAVNKGRQEVHVESQVGTLQIGRTYYYCPHCKAGFFPPG